VLVWWAILLIVLGGLILIGAIVAGVIYCRRNKKPNKLVIPEDHDDEEVTITDDLDDPLIGKATPPGKAEQVKTPTMHGMSQGMKVKNINVTDSNMNNTGLLSDDAN